MINYSQHNISELEYMLEEQEEIAQYYAIDAICTKIALEERTIVNSMENINICDTLVKS